MAGNGLPFLHAAEVVPLIAACTRAALLLSADTASRGFAAPLGMAEGRTAALALRTADMDAAALSGEIARFVEGMAADRPVRIKRGLAGDDPVRAAFVGGRAMLGRRQTGVRDALSVHAAEPVAAWGLARVVAAEVTVAAARPGADLADTLFTLAALRGVAALLARGAADVVNACPVAAVAAVSTERALGAAAAAGLAGLRADRGLGAEFAFLVAANVRLRIADGSHRDTDANAPATLACPSAATPGSVRGNRVGAAPGRRVADAGHVALVGSAANHRRPGHACPALARADVGAEVGARQAEHVVVAWLPGTTAVGLADAAVARFVEVAAVDPGPRRADAVLAAIAHGAAVVVGVATEAVRLRPLDARPVRLAADAVVAGVALRGTILRRRDTRSVLAGGDQAGIVGRAGGAFGAAALAGHAAGHLAGASDAFPVGAAPGAVGLGPFDALAVSLAADAIVAGIVLT